VSEKKKERFRHGPESEQYNKFKNKHITISFGENRLSGKLVWVDVYTVGIQVHPESVEPVIFYKGPGVAVGLTAQSDIGDEWTGRL